MKSAQQKHQIGQTTVFNYISINVTITAENDNRIKQVLQFHIFHNSSELPVVYLEVTVLGSATLQYASETMPNIA